MQQAFAAYGRRDWAGAERICRSILAAQADDFDALNLLGAITAQTRRLDEAVDLLGRASAVRPDNAVAFSNHGNALAELRRFPEAIASYDRAVALQPGYAQAHNNRGNALKELGRLDEALAGYDTALKLQPDLAEAHNNRGYVLQDLRRLDEALASYDKALSLQPYYAEAYNNRGNVLQDLGRPQEALACYDRALALRPNYAEVYSNGGNALKAVGRLEDALGSYQRALALKPDYEFLLGASTHITMQLCHWDSLAQALARCESEAAGSRLALRPFDALGLLDDPALQKAVAERYVRAKFPRIATLGPVKGRAADGKIRLGYYSGDFHDHAVSYLMAELFECHDTQRFELYGFSFGPDRQDAMRKRVSAAFGTFLDVRGKSDLEIAAMSRELGIDIAVDLKGHTQDARLGIFAAGCAPVQVSYLGYPGTTGAEYIDYLIADKTVAPQPACFTEKLAYLPDCYQVNDSTRKIAERAFTREELGLPASGFVFCCFNNNYKIVPSTFDGWVRILQAVPGSVLWLLEDNPAAARNLRKEAQARGLDPDRLVFARRMPLDQHLARHRLADLFLDTLPYNAHTTASDALWAGLPLLTRPGRAFASRVAASLLTAIGLPELIAGTPADYEARAIELAQDPAQLGRIRARLEAQRHSAPLFDARRFARHIESAFEAMYARQQAGLPPDTIDIAG